MAANEPEESYLTVAEVAATLKLNQQTVRNWIDAGTLPALRVGRRVRIKRSDFDRILEESYSGTGSKPAPEPSAADFWGGGVVGLADPGGAGGGPGLQGDEGGPRPPGDKGGPGPQGAGTGAGPAPQPVDERLRQS